MIKSVKRLGILIIIGLFIILYQPPLFSFNSMHIVGILSGLYVLFNLDILLIKKLRYVFLFYAIEFIYLVFTLLLNNGSISLALDPIYYIIDIIPFSLALFIKVRKTNGCFLDVVHCLILVGLIQAILAIAALMNSSIQSFFLSKLISYGYDSSIIDWISSYRLYGFSIGLTYATPVLQTILSVICIYLSTYKLKKHYLIYSIVLFFSGIINARTSIIILIIGISIILLLAKIKILKKVLLIFNLVLVYLFIIIVIMPFLQSEYTYMYDWINSGNESIIDFFKGDSSGYFIYMKNSDSYPLPTDLNGWVIGYGFRSMYSDNVFNIQSDIGYINDLFLGGILYCILIYSVYLLMCIRLIRNKNSLEKFLGVFFLISFILLNIKGYVFAMSGILNTFVLMFIFVKLDSEGGGVLDFNYCASLQCSRVSK